MIELFAFFLTAAGVAAAGAAVTAAIEFEKNLLPGFVNGREKLLAFIHSIGLVVLSILVGILEVPPRYATGTILDVLMLVVSGVVAVYAIGRLSMSVHDDLNRTPGGLTGGDA